MGEAAQDYKFKHSLELARQQQKPNLNVVKPAGQEQSGVAKDSLPNLNNTAPAHLKSAQADNYKNAQPLPSQRLNLNSERFRDLENRRSNNYKDDSSNGSNTEEDHAQRLKEAREKSPGNQNSKLQSMKNAVNNAKKTSKSAANTVKNAFGLLKQIDFISDMPYVAALGAALLKDVTDVVDTEFIILPAIFSTLCAIFIFMMIFLARSGDKRSSTKSAIKRMMPYITDVIGSFADGVPILDYLPIETITVIVIYVQVLKMRQDASVNVGDSSDDDDE